MNILLATTGASPQVLTETLYALHKSGRPFPEKVFVITTQNSKKALIDGLFIQGQLQALCDDYHLPPFEFTEDNIWLLEDDDGNYLNDAKSIDDQTHMANYLTKKVFELTQDANTKLHASLAGGRKTMAFYLGYAMSLYGRPQDTLSHVFVDGSFEFVKDFWYPTPKQKWIDGKNHGERLDCSQAKVTLAEIPFVRMRSSLSESLLNSITEHSFSHTVALINAAVQANVELNFDDKAKLITVAGIDIKLTAREYAFYHWLRNNSDGILVDRYFDETTSHSVGFLNFCYQFKVDVRVFEKTFGITPESFIDGEYHDLKPMTASFVQTLVSIINKKINTALPVELAAKVLIVSEDVPGGQRYRIAAI